MIQLKILNIKMICSFEINNKRVVNPDCTFACLITTSQDDSIYNKSNFDHTLQVFIEGYFTSENWKHHYREQVDTSLGGVKGILVHGIYRVNR